MYKQACGEMKDTCYNYTGLLENICWYSKYFEEFFSNAHGTGFQS
jgi:hypothetical protein